MSQPNRPPLTPAERDEKLRLRAEIARIKPQWERRHQTKLTQDQIGMVVGEVMRGEALSQSAVWQYLSPKHDTRLNPEFVQACAAALGIDIEAVGRRFLPIGVRGSKDAGSGYYNSVDEAIRSLISRMSPEDKEKVAAYAEFVLFRTEDSE